MCTVSVYLKTMILTTQVKQKKYIMFSKKNTVIYIQFRQVYQLFFNPSYTMVIQEKIKYLINKI